MLENHRGTSQKAEGRISEKRKLGKEEEDKGGGNRRGRDGLSGQAGWRGAARGRGK